VLVIVAGYSRWIMARVLPTKSAADLIAGHWRLLTGLGAIPKALVWDSEGAVGSWRGGWPQLTEDFAAFAGLLGIRIIQCKPGDPKAKGLVERANGYLETSFLPSRVFASPTDWLAKANRRIHRTLQARPSDWIDADTARMLPIPPVDPPGWWRSSLRLPRDHYVRLDTNDYSVRPLAIGRRIELKADLDQVLAFCEVARHARCCARHQSLTDPVHAVAAATGRELARGADCAEARRRTARRPSGGAVSGSLGRPRGGGRCRGRARDAGWSSR
jgi:transposase